MLLEPYTLRRSALTFWVAEGPRRNRSKMASRDRVLDATDRLIAKDARSARLDQRLAREQRKLRSLTSDAAWTQYLAVEAAQMDRSLRWLELATGSGRSRSRRRRP
ncbi:MAG TPA: hypothetical protein VHU80_19875 [Polyangiaceae bacterium]|nr:hypothetical protein [Polyangiaceae bacterium]